MSNVVSASAKDKFVSWLFQTKPLIYPNKKKAMICFVFLCTFSLITQALRWSIPSLQVSGMQCSSCGDPVSESFAQCIEHCLDLSDIQMGVLSGPAFTFSMTLAAIPMGYAADRMSRVRLIWMFSLAWSIAALTMAVSNGFSELLVTCVLIGCAVAIVNPCAFSLLSDYFPPERRSLVISSFSAVIFLGYDAGLATGILGEFLSWRWAFALLGLPGFLLFIPALFMREPARGLSEQGTDFGFQPLTDSFLHDDSDDEFEEQVPITDLSFIQSAMKILKCVPFLMIWFSATIRLLGGFALGGWMPAFYRRVFNLESWEISLYLCIVLTIGGLAGSYAGGFSADYWSKRSKVGKLWLVASSTAISIPFIIGMLLIPNVWASLACLFIASFFGEMWFGSSAAAVQDIVDPKLRSFATSIYLTGIGVGGISSVFVGFLNELIAVEAPYSTPGDISYDPSFAMLIIIPTSYFLCCIGYIVTALFILKKGSTSAVQDAIAGESLLDDYDWDQFQ